MRQVGLLGSAIWLGVMVGVAGLLSQSDWQVDAEDLADYGLVFLAYVALTSVLARRCMDVSMVVVAIWGAAVGLWGPGWLRLCDSAILRWAGKMGWGEFFGRDDVRAAIGLAAAGVLTAALLYIATRSSKVVVLTVVASLGAAAVVALPAGYAWGDAAAVLLWNGLVCAGLCGWMVMAMQRRGAGCCPRCAHDVRGLSSPVCPACSAVLAKSDMKLPAVAPMQRRPV